MDEKNKYRYPHVIKSPFFFNFIGSSVVYLSLSEIPIWTHQRQFGLNGDSRGWRRKRHTLCSPCYPVGSAGLIFRDGVSYWHWSCLFMAQTHLQLISPFLCWSLDLWIQLLGFYIMNNKFTTSLKIYFAVLEEICNNVVAHWSLVGRFNLLQSFQYTPYLFTKMVQIRDKFFLYMDPVGSCYILWNFLAFYALSC